MISKDNLKDAQWLREIHKTHTLGQIAAACGYSVSTVKSAMRGHGIEIVRRDPRHIDQLKTSEWLNSNYPKKTTEEIAKELNCHVATIHAAMVRFGIQREKIIPYPQLKDANYLRERYGEVGYVELAKEIGCSPGAVNNAFKKLGIVGRRCGVHARIETLWDEDYLKKLSEEYTVNEIAKLIGCHHNSVRAAFGRFGIKTKNGHIPKTKQSRKYSSKKDANNHYIPEYRAIVEQKIGRRLSSTEHVHHLDHNPENNSLDNLTILSREDHTSHHSSNRKIPFICIICGVEGLGGNYAKKYCDSCGKIIRYKRSKTYQATKRTLKSQLGAH